MAYLIIKWKIDPSFLRDYLGRVRGVTWNRCVHGRLRPIPSYANVNAQTEAAASAGIEPRGGEEPP